MSIEKYERIRIMIYKILHQKDFLQKPKYNSVLSIHE